MGLPRNRTYQRAKGKGSGTPSSLCWSIIYICLLCCYLARTHGAIDLSNIVASSDAPSTPSSSSGHLPLAKGKKRKKEELPSRRNNKARHVAKVEEDVKIKDANEPVAGDMDELDVNYRIFENIVPNESETAHTRRRQKSAAAWRELMPSLVYPLLVTLHKINSNEPENTFGTEKCTSSTCKVQSSVVKVVSFGGK
jgi:hypothetical protein